MSKDYATLPLFDAPDEDERVIVWTLPSGVRLVQLEDGTYADAADPEGAYGRPKWRVYTEEARKVEQK